MLQGTFETLSLPEVLGLLASARKSGALWLEAGPIVGVVHLEDGHCHATIAGDVTAPVETGPELLARLVDLCFACMCQESGSFRFAADDPAPWWCPEPVELSDAMVEVDRLLKQWREILRVIPSLECRPQLLDALEVDELIIDRERWALLVAIDGRRTVRELVARADRPMIDVCHVLLEFVEAGAIGVIDPAAARAPEPDMPEQGAEAFEPAPGFEDGEHHAVEEIDPVEAELVEEAPEPQELQAEAEPQYEPAPDTAPPAEPEYEPEPVMHAVPVEAAVNGGHAEHVEYGETAPMAAVSPGDSGGSESADKGAFLRLFSGLRES